MGCRPRKGDLVKFIEWDDGEKNQPTPCAIGKTKFSGHLFFLKSSPLLSGMLPSQNGGSIFPFPKKKGWNTATALDDIAARRHV